jgi:hypothetical protein
MTGPQTTESPLHSAVSLQIGIENKAAGKHSIQIPTAASKRKSRMFFLFDAVAFTIVAAVYWAIWWHSK